MSSGRSTCSRVRDGSGPRSAARVRNQAGRRVAGCATYTRTAGVRHLAAYELGEDKLYGHIKPRKTRARFLEFCRYLRSLYPPATRIAIICGNFSPHLTTRTDRRVGTWATAANVEIACTPTNSSWLNRIEAQFTALRYFTLDGTDHATRKGAGQHDPPVHHLAQQPRLRRTAPPYRRQGERSLMRRGQERST
jgi:hypothetical protein